MGSILILLDSETVDKTATSTCVPDSLSVSCKYNENRWEEFTFATYKAIFTRFSYKHKCLSH